MSSLTPQEAERDRAFLFMSSEAKLGVEERW